MTTLTPEKTEVYTIPPDLDVPEDVQETLRKMRDLLARPRGWCRWTLSLKRSDGLWAYCMVGALQEVTRGDSAATNARRTAVRGVLSDVLPRPIEKWNDNPRRKQSHVVALLDELTTKE